MIDMTKQYTHNGKPVRIYADGSDTAYSKIHGAVYDNDIWYTLQCDESDLVEVWEPKEGEWCLFWNPETMYGIEMSVAIFYKYGKNGVFYTDKKVGYQNCIKFTGTLPAAFKGL